MRHTHTKGSAHDRVTKQNLRHLVTLCLLFRVLISTVALLASYLPAFDSSADVLLADKSSSLLKRWISTSLRWDSFYFIHIARENYQFEHEWAFLPGVPIILHITGRTIDILIRNISHTSNYSILFGQFLVSCVVSCETARTLYLLTMEHTQSPALSLLSGYLHFLSSSPVTAHLAPYAEPWFSLFSYNGMGDFCSSRRAAVSQNISLGMLFSAQKRWFSASVSFALATLFRSNGVFLGGFVAWGMVVEPFITYRRVRSNLRH